MDTSSQQHPPTEFFFTKTSITNTEIHKYGKPAFRVSTLDNAGAITKITDLSTGALVATIKRHNFRSDTVRFAKEHYQGRKLKLKEWLKEVKSTDGSDSWLFQHGSSAYIWHFDENKEIMLSSASEDGETIARVYAGTKQSPRLLQIEEGGDAIIEVIIAGYVALGHRLQLRQQSGSVHTEARLQRGMLRLG